MKNIVSISLAFLTSLICVFSVNHIVYSFQKDNALKADCKNYNLTSTVEKKVEIDIEEEIVYVSERFIDNDQNDAYVYKLPLLKSKNQNDLVECSPQSINFLNEVQSIYKEYITESCADFKHILQDKDAVPVKNGVKANIEGAKEFVNKFCNK